MKRVSWMAMLAAGLISHPGLSGQGIDIIPQPLVAEAQPGGSVLDGKVAIANADPVDTLREESAEGFDLRMAWWRQARFGLFLHWGVYAVPAGEWNGSTNHAEWILSTAQIPLQRYKQFASQFNPVGFDAAEWVRMAKEAGMKYIVITSKHHDGFCLFDSAATDYDVVEATPFRRDILKELSEECRRQGIRMGLYYSIMDWQHPDYLPRRSWEDRSAQGADFRRYVDYMKAQLRELIDRYDPAILWFDGEWEPTWSHEQGVQLYNAVRSLKPDILVNNRVDTGRGGRPGGREARKYVGDFGTPEQEVPAAGTPGYDWESCMTMNRHWGWNKNDKEFKSTTVLIRQLIDCASKGGNYLLNVGPKPDGTFPQESIERLGEIGRWMKVNGQSIYGTTASVFPPLPWGRSTTKDRTLYLHVFERPAEGRIWVPGLISEAEKAYLLADPSRELGVEYADAGAHVRVPSSPTDRSATVIALEFRARPEVVVLPEITGAERFYPSTEVRMDCGTDLAQIHYTLDSTEPTQDSQAYTRPLQLDRTVAVQCRVFHRGVPVTPVARKEFTRLRPKEAEERSGVRPGLRYRAFLGRWEKLPAFSDLTPDRSGTVDHLDLEVKPRPEFFAIVYEGYVRAPQEGLYAFSLDSDDGSRLYIGGELVVDNDGLHSPQGKAGVAPLKKGLHPIRVEYLQGEGGALLDVTWTAPDAEPQEMPADLLFHL